MNLKNSNSEEKSFEELKVSPLIRAELLSKKVIIPTEIQAKAIPIILSGCDVVAVAQTGSGKTLAFVIPTLLLLEKNKSTRALVLAPSREMAQQIYLVFVDFCRLFGIQPCLVIGGIPTAVQISQLKKNPRLLVATPGRLNDHLINNKLLLKDVEIVVIDEADRMIDLGFLPQLKNIQKTLRGEKQTLLFTASFKPELEQITSKFMKKEVVLIRTRGAETPVSTLKQNIVFVSRNNKDQALLQALTQVLGTTLIFTSSQDSCERVNDYLKSQGFICEFIHGDLNQGHRQRIIRELRQDSKKIIVTTDLLARGLDVPHITCIINYDLPFLAEDFIHRIGRTARAGQGGQAITFISPSDEKMFVQIKPYISQATEVQEENYLLDKLRGLEKHLEKKSSIKVRKDKYKK